MVAQAAFHSDRSIDGTYFSPDQRQGQRALMRIAGDSVVVVVEGARLMFPINAVAFGLMDGEQTADIQLGGHAWFRTTDLDGVQHITGHDEDGAVPEVPSSRLHTLTLVFSALIIAGLLTLTWFRGMPFLESSLAQTISSDVKEDLSSASLRFLDAEVLRPSRLDSEERHSVVRLLSESSRAASSFLPKVKFRSSEALGPNAVALPDGTIVLTDQLVKRLTPNELRAVVAHQMGHIFHHHSMRALIAENPLAWFMAVASGDYQRLTRVTPDKLLNVRYTAQMENAADEFALEYYAALGYTQQDYSVALDQVIRSHLTTRISPKLGPWLSNHGYDHHRGDVPVSERFKAAGL